MSSFDISRTFWRGDVADKGSVYVNIGFAAESEREDSRVIQLFHLDIHNIHDKTARW